MSFFVCQIGRDLSLGHVFMPETIEEAINLVQTMVQEKGVEITKEIEEEIQNDYGYVDDDLQWSVQIGIIN
jgi:hypothetical protein